MKTVTKINLYRNEGWKFLLKLSIIFKQQDYSWTFCRNEGILTHKTRSKLWSRENQTNFLLCLKHPLIYIEFITTFTQHISIKSDHNNQEDTYFMKICKFYKLNFQRPIHSPSLGSPWMNQHLINTRTTVL